MRYAVTLRNGKEFTISDDAPTAMEVLRSLWEASKDGGDPWLYDEDEDTAIRFSEIAAIDSAPEQRKIPTVVKDRKTPPASPTGDRYRDDYES